MQLMGCRFHHMCSFGVVLNAHGIPLNNPNTQKRHNAK